VFIPEGKTVNKEIHIDILRCLRDAVGRKRPEIWRTNSWLLRHHNDPANKSVFVKDFLLKNNVKTREHPPLIGFSWFYLFSGLEAALKGECFCNVTDIFKNAMEELKRLSQNGFPKRFKHLHSLAEVYNCTRGQFWRKCSLNDCNVLYFS
jgi:hypothetical protein